MRRTLLLPQLSAARRGLLTREGRWQRELGAVATQLRKAQSKQRQAVSGRGGCWGRQAPRAVVGHVRSLDSEQRSGCRAYRDGRCPLLSQRMLAVWQPSKSRPFQSSQNIKGGPKSVSAFQTAGEAEEAVGVKAEVKAEVEEER
eukprot:2799510-Rhodomonas_salina.1